jgi:molybdopterin-guanine dinucleotide biosynthesis protein
MVTIGIGGAHSKSGKTLMACRLIAALGTDALGRIPCAAIKCTPTQLYTSVVDDPDVLAEPATDTGRMTEAGATEVRWVQAAPDTKAEALGMALDSLADHPVVIIEGNSAVELLSPDIVIFILSEGGRLKPGADRILARADVVLAPDGTPSDGLPHLPPGARVFDPDEDWPAHVAVLLGERGARD